MFTRYGYVHLEPTSNAITTYHHISVIFLNTLCNFWTTTAVIIVIPFPFYVYIFRKNATCKSYKSEKIYAEICSTTFRMFNFYAVSNVRNTKIRVKDSKL